MDKETLQEAQNLSLMPYADGHPVCNLFEDMVMQGQMTFSDRDTSGEESFTRDMITLMRHWGLTCEIGSQKVGRSVLLRTDNSYIQYIDIYPETGIYLMCGKDHQESIPEQEGLMYLMIQKRGMSQIDAEALYASLLSGELDGLNVFGVKGKA